MGGAQGQEPAAKPAAEQQKQAANDPFTPEPAPPLPAGMTGSDVRDPRYGLKAGLYNAAAVARGLRHISLLKKPDT
jgi:hypothetical protein